MNYCETYEYDQIGYQKLFHHHNWRIAMLNYIDELEIDRIEYVESHQLTDEVFVLLQGKASLFFADQVEGKINQIVCQPLETGKVYKVAAGVFHSHTLSHDAKLLVVEEENTGYQNSPRIYLSPAEKMGLQKAFQEGSCAV